jgi:hypothetical protein
MRNVFHSQSLPAPPPVHWKQLQKRSHQLASFLNKKFKWDVLDIVELEEKRFDALDTCVIEPESDEDGPVVVELSEDQFQMLDSQMNVT